MNYTEKLFSRRVNTRAFVAEFVGMTLFVYAACGIPTLFTAQTSEPSYTTMASGVQNERAIAEAVVKALGPDLLTNGGFRVIAAMGFGFSILVLAYAIGHISGCHLNPSVSLALWLSGTEDSPGRVHCGVLQLVGNIVAQCAGSILGAALLMGSCPNGVHSSLASNVIATNVTNGTAFLGECVMTFLLCLVVLLTVADKTNNLAPMAPVAIGLAVFLGNALLIPIDGASINFARSLGPAVVSGTWSTEQYGSTPENPIHGPGRFWVFFVGPIVGGLLSVPVWWLLSSNWGDSQPAGARAKAGSSEENGKLDA